VIFITHNVHHAYPVGDAFTILNRGRTSREEVLNMMAGGKELEELSSELEEFARPDAGGGSKLDPAAAAEHAIAQSRNRCTRSRKRFTSTEPPRPAPASSSPLPPDPTAGTVCADSATAGRFFHAQAARIAGTPSEFARYMS
jgi:hypothetical protein